MTRLVTVDLDLVPGAILASIAAVLARHGVPVADKVLDECSRNASHAVAMLDDDGEPGPDDMIDAPDPALDEGDSNRTLGLTQSVFR